MNTIFEGYSFARSHAEEISRKNKDKDYYIVKTKTDGIKYSVTTDITLLRSGDKVMDHYKNGQISE